MFSSVEHKEEAVRWNKLGLRLHTLSDLDTKSVPHKQSRAHIQAHTSSVVSAEGDDQCISPRVEMHSSMCCKS